MKKGVYVALMIMIVTLLSGMHAMAVDYDYFLNLSDLPFDSAAQIDFAGTINGSYLITYGQFLSGIDQITLNTSTFPLMINISIPKNTSFGDHTSFVNIHGNGTDENKSFVFTVEKEEVLNISPDNFSMTVTESSVWDDFFEMRFYGPNGTTLYVNTSSLSKRCDVYHTSFCDVQLLIKEQGYASFLYAPESNGQHATWTTFIFKNQTFKKQLDFNISTFNDLAFDFNFSPSRPSIGQSVVFTSDVDSYEDSVTYKWDFENDWNIDATTPNVTKIFSSKGNYVVNLTLTDSIKSISVIKQINVTDLIYNVTVIVKAGTQFVDSAQVSLGSVVKYSDSNGTVSFEVEKGNHSLVIVKERYDRYNTTLVVQVPIQYTVDLIDGPDYVTDNSTQKVNSKSAVVALTPEDIQLKSPSDKSRMGPDLVTLTYIVMKPNVNTCQLYLKQNNLNFMIKDTNSKVTLGQVEDFTLRNMKAANYTWKVRCKDNSSEAFSEELTFFVEDENQKIITDEVNNIDRLITNVNNAIVNFRTLNSEEYKFILRLLSVEEELYKQKDELVTLKKKIQDAADNEDKDYIDREIVYAKQKQDALKKTMIKNVSILDSSHFIYLPSDLDIEQVAEEFISTRSDEDDIDKKAYLKRSKAFQKDVNVDTSAYLVELNYASSAKDYMTIIQRKVTVGTDYGNHSYIESIPKEIAKSYEELKMFGNDFKVLKYDPLIEFDITESNNIVYAVKKRMFLNEIEKIKGGLMDADIDKNATVFGMGMPFFTGLISFVLISAGIVFSWFIFLSKRQFGIAVKGRLSCFAESAIGIFKKKPQMTVPVPVHKEDIDIGGKVTSLVNEVLDYAMKGDEEKAGELYCLIDEMFNAADGKIKVMIAEKLSHLRHELILIQVKNLIEQTTIHIGNGLLTEAKAIYDEILSHYKDMPSHHQMHLKETMQILKASLLELYEKMKTGALGTEKCI